MNEPLPTELKTEPPIEIEGKGLDYERYALNKLFARLVKRYDLKDILEMPAKGEKAMPSIYSIGFVAAGCNVTLMNAEEKSRWAWEELNFPVSRIISEDLCQTTIESNQYDLFWNFMHLAKAAEKKALLQEMTRISRRYVLFIGVNRFNPGFFSHRLVHRITKVPWNHGDVRFMNPFHVRRYFAECGLKTVELGVVDTPPYPDSIGFRDMRLHRKNVDLNKIDWDSRTIYWMKDGKWPMKLRFLYFFEWLPLPFLIKLSYAHLFYILVEK